MNVKIKAMGFVLAAVLVATVQDAVVKYLQGGYPTWEAVAFRGALATPFFFFWAWALGVNLLIWPKQGWLVVLRSAVIFSGYISFALALATMPMADAAVIYFTMPFIVALLSAPFLGERVPPYRWVAILAGFAGVLIASNPTSAFQPAALLALYAAFGYAFGALILRRVESDVPPLFIANVQSLFYFLGAVSIGGIIALSGAKAEGGALAALTQPFAWPSAIDFSWMVIMGLTSCISSAFFVKAYQLAHANFVAPFEYSAFLWSIVFGFAVFGDFPTQAVLMGALVVIGAGLFMLAFDARQSRG